MNPPTHINNHLTQTYAVDVGGRKFALLGPADPDALLDDPRTEERYHAENEFMPYWARPWAASVMLAEFALKQIRAFEAHGELPRGQAAAIPNATTHSAAGALRVLELGCGLGLVGLALAQHGCQVLMTDYDEDALAFVRASAELNGLTERITVQRFVWERDNVTEPFDLIIGADILFEQRWVRPVAELLAAALQVAKGAASAAPSTGDAKVRRASDHAVAAESVTHWTPRALVSDPNRRTSAGFADVAAALQLTVTSHAADAVDFDGQPTPGTIYELR